MRYRISQLNICAPRQDDEQHPDPIVAIEAFVPLLLALHGFILLLWLGDTHTWQWVILAGLCGLSLLQVLGGYAMPALSAGRAAYIGITAWLLMISTGGAVSFFALWNFVLVAVYPLVLRSRYTPFLPPVVATAYLLLLPFTAQLSLPLALIFSRAFLLCFIGWLAYLCGSVLRHQTQSHVAIANQLAAEHRQLHRAIVHNQAVLDSLAAHVAVLDKAGVIIAVNQPWARFATANGNPSPQATGVGVDYLAVCDQATGEFATEAPAIAAGLRAVLASQVDLFSLEYPCHSPTEQRWFLLHAAPLVDNGGGAVVSHTNITKRKEAEAALQKSEAYNRALLAAIPDAIGRIHRDGTCLDMRAPNNFEMTVPPATAIGKKLAEYLPPAAAQQNMTAIVHTLATGELQAVEYQLVDQGGVQVREARIVPYAQDEVITIIRDITTRRLTEDALRKSEARFRALLEAIPDGMVRLHRNGTYLDVKASGDFEPVMVVERLVGKNVRELLEPQVAQQFLAVAHEALDKDERQIFEYAVTIGEQQRMREGRVVPVGEDEVIFILRDITERKRAEAELRQSEERYRTLAELSPDAILVNVDGRYVYANAAAVRLFGAKDAQEIIGRSPLAFLDPAYHPITRERMRDVLEQKQSVPLIEYHWQRLDGALVAVEVAAGPSTWNGQPAIQVVQRDITVRKQAEAEKARLHAEVSQQRTQLRALTARLAEVQENERKALARELHDQVGQNLSTLGLHLKIIQNQLLLALPVAEPIQTLLNDTQGLIKQTTERVRNVMAELRPPMLDDYGLPAALEWYANRVAKRGNFAVQIAATADLPRLSAAVENALFRITQEAITNIMKHAQATSVVINLVVDAQQTALTIRDNGRGIDPAILTGAPHEGWGLLSMRERAEALGGRFTIASQPGQGTSLQIVIPRTDSPPDDAQHRTAVRRTKSANPHLSSR